MAIKKATVESANGFSIIRISKFDDNDNFVQEHFELKSSKGETIENAKQQNTETVK